MKIYYNGLKNYQPWDLAIETMAKIREHNLIDEFENWLKGEYNGEINQTELNDLLTFTPEIVYETLNIEYEKEDNQ